MGGQWGVWVSAALVGLAACAPPATEAPPDEAPDTELAADDDTGAPPACAPPAPADPSQVGWSRATVQGELADGVVHVAGLRYAAPPTGALRWRPSAPPACEDEVVDGTVTPPSCPQWGDDGATGDEDCLFLSVWAPEDAVDAPELVYFHGGGHEQGSLSVALRDGRLYDGAALAARGVVVVVAQYRLGVFGFLAHPDLADPAHGNGNWGTLDQTAALGWVRDEIAALGGDPDRVTIMGQSAGGVSVCRVATAPRAAGLAQQAVVLSAACAATAEADAEVRGADVFAALSCDDASCLRQAPWDALVEATPPLADVVSFERGWDGVIDGVVVPEAPAAVVADGRAHVGAVLVSATDLETGAVVPDLADEAAFRSAVAALLRTVGLQERDVVLDRVVDAYRPGGGESWGLAYVRVGSDLKFICPSRRDLAAWRAAEVPAWRLHFDESLDRALPAMNNLPIHSSDLPWWFERVDAFGALAGPADLAEATDLADVLAAFVATGDPRPDARDWPQWSADVDPAWRVASPGAGRVDGARAPQCDLWASLSP